MITINELYEKIHEINEEWEITYTERTVYKQDVIKTSRQVCVYDRGIATTTCGFTDNGVPYIRFDSAISELKHIKEYLSLMQVLSKFLLTNKKYLVEE